VFRIPAAVSLLVLVSQAQAALFNQEIFTVASLPGGTSHHLMGPSLKYTSGTYRQVYRGLVPLSDGVTKFFYPEIKRLSGDPKLKGGDVALTVAASTLQGDGSYMARADINTSSTLAMSVSGVDCFKNDDYYEFTVDRNPNFSSGCSVTATIIPEGNSCPSSLRDMGRQVDACAEGFNSFEHGDGIVATDRVCLQVTDTVTGLRSAVMTQTCD
jgi:hypothetical protein